MLATSPAPHSDAKSQFVCNFRFWRVEAQTQGSLDAPGVFASWVQSLPARVLIRDGFTFRQPATGGERSQVVDARCRSMATDRQSVNGPPDFTAYSDKGIPG